MSDYVSPVIIDSAHPQLRAGTRKTLFQVLSMDAAVLTGIPAATIKTALETHENEAPSSIGSGVALPHLKFPGITRPCMLLASLARGIAFDTPDGQAVDLVFLLISPESDGPLHLRRLSRLSRMLKNASLCDNLRHARTADEIHAILSCTGMDRIAA